MTILNTSAKMPQGTVALQFIQLFSTMSFAVLYSVLVLYATKRLGLGDSVATSLTAMFFAFNYGLHLLGGFVGGRFLSYRSLFSLGMVFIIAGCLCISVPHLQEFYLGAALFLTGSGLNVTCINCMVTQLFHQDDKRRETAFMWNYSMMNVGFFIGFFISGIFQKSGAYANLFILSASSNVIALLLTFWHWHKLKDLNTEFSLAQNQKRRNLYGLLITFALFAGLRLMVEHPIISTQAVIYGAAIMLLVILCLAVKQEDHTDKLKMFAFVILAVLATIFWTLYQLTPDGLTLFIDRNVNRHIGGFVVPTPWYQNINPIVIMLGGPLLGHLFQHFRKNGFNVSLPLQFGTALLLIGIAIGLLPIGIYLANAEGYTNTTWVVFTNILLSLGELFIGPVGYAMVGQLAPERLRGVLMGTWMMTSGTGVAIAGFFSHMAVTANNTANPLVTNSSYSHIFGLLAAVSILGGFTIFLLGPLLSKLIQEKPHH